MNSYEVHGLRVSSSAVREALGQGRMDDAAALLGGPTASAATWCTGASWAAAGPGRGHPMGMRTLNLRFAHWKPAASGIFVKVLVHGLTPKRRVDGRGQPGHPPSLDPMT
jgi:riboflavin kinase/FMN adenylyltransferase